MKQRVLHVIDTLDRTGTAQQLHLLVRGLPQDQFEVQVCALSRGGPIGDALAQAGIPVYAIGRRWAADPTTFLRLAVTSSNCGPTRSTPGRRRDGPTRQPWHSVAACLAWWPCGGRSNATQGPSKRPSTAMSAVGPARSWRLARLSAIIASGKALPAKRSTSFLAARARRTPAAVTRGQIFDRLGLPESARLIGWAGRLEADHGGKDAIWAADLLKVIRDDAHLLIFGAGPHGQRLARFREQVQIADKVHFLGDRGDLAEFLPHFDQFWSTRRLPGQSQAVLEAMAAGTPVIAADVPGSEASSSTTSPAISSPWDIAPGCARWAEHLLNHPEKARQVGAAGRQRVENEFSAENMVRSWKLVDGGQTG